MTTQAHAFDFVYGTWAIKNRELRDVTDPTCTQWVEFDATSEALPILQGIGHIDRIHVPDPPDGPPFEGFTLRLFDPTDDLWRIWWSSTRSPGTLDPPVVGRFRGGHGLFECDDVVGGHQVQVRFEWAADPSGPVWRQSFSYDDGATWNQNWTLTLSRPRL